MNKPNILFICTDQQRGDCLSIENHPVLLTPNMDNIARNGIRFTSAYSSCPSCIAARRSMMLGQTHGKHGLVGYREGVIIKDPTLPQVLQDNGYQTAIVGRSMHQSPRTESYGYEYMTAEDTYEKWLKENISEDCGGCFGGGVMHNDWTARTWPLPDYAHRTNWTVTQAMKYLEGRDMDRPFFLTLSFVAPHPPLQPPQFYFDRYIRTGVPVPDVGDWVVYNEDHSAMKNLDCTAPDTIKLEGEALLSARAAYYGLINNIDDQIRRILNPVIGLSNRDTVIIFTSDHGEMLGDHHMWRKSRPYESCARVPFMISVPDEYEFRKGAVSDAAVTHADIMPTLLDLAGIDIPDTVDGKSLVPVMRGESEKVRDYLHIEHAPYPHGITDGREKFIWNHKDGSEQFFDLKNDPKECRNLINDSGYQDRVTLWRKRLVDELSGRPEGFSDGEKLISGQEYAPLIPGRFQDDDFVNFSRDS